MLLQLIIVEQFFCYINVNKFLFCVKNGIVIVYDCTNNDSFKNLSKWLKKLDNLVQTEVTKLLCGNKVDLDEKTVSLLCINFVNFNLGFKNSSREFCT
jgi:GTPase SAR1 family protein